MNERAQASTTYPITFFMADATDHITGKTGLTPTVTLSKNGAAFGAAAGAVSEIGNGWYALAGNATDRGTLGELAVHAEAAGADAFDGRYVIVPWDTFDGAGLGLSRIDAAISSRSTLAQSDILSDAAPFAGANIDAAISSRSSHADPTTAIKGDPGKTNQEIYDALLPAEVYTLVDAIARRRVCLDSESNQYVIYDADGNELGRCNTFNVDGEASITDIVDRVPV